MNGTYPSTLVSHTQAYLCVLITLLLALGCDSEQSSTPPNVEDAGILDVGAPDSDAMAMDAAVGDMASEETDAMTVDADTDSGPSVNAEMIWNELRAQIDNADVRAMVVMFGDASGPRFVHEKSAQRDQIFPIASASKLVTAVLILKLVEEGVLALGDHPQQYLGDLGWTNDPEDARSRVTLAQLLSFTSGFAGGTGLGLDEGIECINTGATADGETSLEACVMDIYQNHFSFEPGTTYFYGPAHMHIAAAMAAQATGDRWGRLFRRYLYEPLGMTGTTGYNLPSTENPRASGGMVMNADNYAKLLTALMNGTLLSAESMIELTRDHTPIGTRFESVPATADEYGDWHYGFGCWRECPDSEYSEACDGPSVISSPGAFGFYPWFDQERGYWGLISTQIRLRGSSITVPLGHAWYTQAIEALDQP